MGVTWSRCEGHHRFYTAETCSSGRDRKQKGLWRNVTVKIPIFVQCNLIFIKSFEGLQYRWEPEGALQSVISAFLLAVVIIMEDIIHFKSDVMIMVSKFRPRHSCSLNSDKSWDEVCLNGVDGAGNHCQNTSLMQFSYTF